MGKHRHQGIVPSHGPREAGARQPEGQRKRLRGVEVGEQNIKNPVAGRRSTWKELKKSSQCIRISHPSPEKEWGRHTNTM